MTLVVYNDTFDLVFVVALRRATSFPNVLISNSERVDTSFPNVLIHELEVHCNSL